MTTSRSRDQLTPLPMEEEPTMEQGLPVVLRRRHRWVSQATERRIEEAWGTQWAPSDLSGLPKGTPLTPLTETARRCTFPTTLLSVWVPRCIPVSSHCTQDGMLCGRRPRGGRRLFLSIPGCYPASNQKGPNPGCINLGISNIIDDRLPEIPHGEDSVDYSRYP